MLAAAQTFQEQEEHRTNAIQHIDAVVIKFIELKSIIDDLSFDVVSSIIKKTEPWKEATDEELKKWVREVVEGARF